MKKLKNFTDSWRWRNFKKGLKHIDGDAGVILSGLASCIEELEHQILYLEQNLNDILRKEEEKEDDLH